MEANELNVSLLLIIVGNCIRECNTLSLYIIIVSTLLGGFKGTLNLPLILGRRECVNLCLVLSVIFDMFIYQTYLAADFKS